MARRVIAVSDSGHALGEDHKLAKLTNVEVDLVRELHDIGYGYKRLAMLFAVSRSHVRNIVKYRVRPTGMRWRTIRV